MTSPRLIYVIGRLDHVVRRELDKRLAAQGLTVAQYTALSVLRVRSGLSNAQLARRSHVSPQSMNTLLASLEQKGLIERQVSPEHRRVLRVRLTERGREMAELCDKLADEVEAVMLNGMPERERDALASALRACVERMNAGLQQP